MIQRSYDIMLTSDQIQLVRDCCKDAASADMLINMIENLLGGYQNVARFRAILNSMADVIFSLDREQRHTGVYGRWLSWPGVNASMFLGKTAREIMGEEVAAIHEAANTRALAGDTVTYEWQTAQQFFQTTVSPLMDAADNIVGVVGIGRDITRLKLTERALKASNDLYDDLVRHIPSAAYRFQRDAEGRPQYEYISPRCLDLNGIDAAALMQLPDGVASLMHPDDAGRYWEAVRQMMDNPRPFVWEGRMIINGETRWHRLESRPHRTAEGAVIWHGLQSDITERKQTEALRLEQERLQLALRQEQDMNHLRHQMLARIGHEFRTPLAIIQSTSDMLARYSDRITADRREEHLLQINRQIAHMVQMLNAIHEAVRPDNGSHFPPAPFDCRQMVLEFAEQFRREWPSHRLALTISDEVNQITGDTDAIQHILSSLLSNAVKYSDDGTTIHLSVFIEAGSLVLCVQDEGSGILPADQPHIFEPFYRGSNAGRVSGLGLGLSFAQQAVAALNGSIHFDSQPGAGTTFTVTLPVGLP